MKYVGMCSETFGLKRVEKPGHAAGECDIIQVHTMSLHRIFLNTMCCEASMTFFISSAGLPRRDNPLLRKLKSAL